MSGSAALQMASASMMSKEVREIVAHEGAIPGGVIPLRHTIFLWQSLLSVVVEIVLVTALVHVAAPRGSRVRTHDDLGISLGPPPSERATPERRGTPGEWLEHSRLLPAAFVALAGRASAGCNRALKGRRAARDGLRCAAAAPR